MSFPSGCGTKIIQLFSPKIEKVPDYDDDFSHLKLMFISQSTAAKAHKRTVSGSRSAHSVTINNSFHPWEKYPKKFVC